MKKTYVVISRSAEPSLIKDENFLKNKTTSQIENDLKLVNEKLYITTPFIRWPLGADDIPLDIYPQIILHENPGKFTRPKFYLTILPSGFDYTFFVTPITDPSYKIPAFEVSIKVDQSNPVIDSKCFLEAAIKQFQLESTDYQLQLHNEPMPDSLNINQLKNSNISMYCKLSEKSQLIVRTRINIIQEIQTTENTYIMGLTTLYDKYRKDLLSKGLINRDEDILIFRNFPSIIGCHQSFMDSITKRAEESPYGAIYSDVFIDFSSYFKISLDYITNYHKYISLIVEKSKDKDWKKKLDDLANVHGPVQSYLITPVQRMPRYILFLRELIKYTPPSHPDAELLKIAADSVKEITEQIDESAIIAENKNAVLNINSLVDNFNLLDVASRVFVIQFDVHINRNSRNPHVLYIFNDLIYTYRKK